MATQYKTLQFPNTPDGQAEKTKALAREAADGWEVVSETITSGKFKGGKACCLFVIFAPCAFLAGHKDDVITVTLVKKDRVATPPTGPTVVTSQPPPASPSQAAPPLSNQRAAFADEFLKLAKLKEQGVLTEEEFAQMKAALINKAKKDAGGGSTN